MKIQHFLTLVVLSLATVPGARAAVLAGPLTNAANAHIYYLLSANTWTASEAEAIGLGGHLVTINDAAENQWVVNTFFPLTGGPNDWLWIGLNDAVKEGQFFWAGEEGAVTIWASGEPFTTDVEDYAAIERLSGRWKDLSDTYGLENPTAPTFGVVEVAVAVTQPANQFMPGSARLNGRVSPIGSPTLAWFEWGTSLAYGNATPPQSVGSGGNAVGFFNVVVGLVSGTNYHFRARASNAFGFFAGLNQTFNLDSQRPGVTSLAADQLSYTSARLKGQVNPRGWPTAAWFEWGPTTNYGNVIGMQDVGQGSSALNLSVVLDGLVSGPIYHYRLVATNAFGAVYGADQTINLGVVPTKITWTGANPSGYWSTPANWFPNGVPTNGADLVFPGGLPPEDMVSTNDLTDSIFRSITFGGAGGHTIHGNPITLTNRTDCIIHSGTNVIACDLTFSGTPATPTFTTIRSSSFGSGELTMTGNIGGGSLYAFGGRLVIRGQFTGGTLRQYGGTLAFYGDHSHAVSVEFQGDSSTLFVQGSQPNLNITLLWEMESAACPHFTGDGVVGDVTGCGHITLDSTLSVKNISRGVCGTCYYNTLAIRLNGTDVGEYGRLVASGDVSVNTGSLLPSPGFNPQPGQVFTIVEKTSPGPIANAFLGPEGKITTLNGMPFRISYVGGDGNDVTLTATLPQLNIARTNPAQVRLSWPTNYPGFQLLRASAIDGSASWSNHPMSPVVMGSNYTVAQPVATNREFFRLKQP
jgi:hypothetical protein